MAIKQGESVHLDAFCPQCEASYYRTSRPLIVGRDKLTPDLFVPIKAGTPPPNPDKPECPTCSSPLRFIAATNVAKTEGSPAVATAGRDERVGITRQAAPTVAGTPTAEPAERGIVNVLFSVEPDEQVVDIKDAGGAYLVVTNRRIVKVSYE